MALVPDLTRDDGSRVLLNSARHAMTMMSNCAVFIAMWAMLRVAGAGGALTPNACAPGFDLAPIYQALSLFVVTVGGVCTAVFLAGTPERPALPLLDGAATVATIGMQQRRNLAAAAAPAAGGVNRPTGDGNDAGADAGALSTGIEMRTVQVKSCSAPSPVSRAETFGAGAGAGAATDLGLVAHEDHVSVAGALSGQEAGAAPSCRVQQMTWREWLGLRAFFQVMAVYSLTRLATNVSQVYLSFFVTASLGMDETSIALVPLLLYLAQLSATLSLKPVVARLGRRNAITLGAALISAACALMLTLDQASSGGIYPAMLLLGAGSAISMVISVSLESDLIGANTESGAFVYGACSFADKLGNGVSIVALQLAGSGLADRSEAKGAFFRVVNGLVPMAAIAAATLVCWTISFPKHLRSHAQQLREADAPTVCA
jgi:Na+/melibiose symporter-like transporter